MATRVLKDVLIYVSSMLTLLYSTSAHANDDDYELKPDPNPWVTQLGSVFIPVLVHETGHALTGVLLGGRLKSFKPFPHMSEGRLVGGSVALSGLSGWRDTMTTLMGTGTNVLFVLAAAPALPHIKNIQNRYLLQGSLTVAAADFFVYTVADTLGFSGDWSELAQKWKIPVWTLIPVGAGVSYALLQYLATFDNKRPDESIIEGKPIAEPAAIHWSTKKLSIGGWNPFVEHSPRQNSWALGLAR